MGISFLNFTIIFFIVLINFLLKDSFEPLINYINNGFEFYSKYEIFLKECCDIERTYSKKAAIFRRETN